MIKGISLKGICAAGAAALLVSCTQQAAAPLNEPAERASKQDLLDEFAAVMAKAEETSGPGRPRIWTLSDEDTRIYFFGTVHLLRPSVEWRFDAFDNALAEADTVVFEVDMKSEEGLKAVTRDFNQRGMFQDGRNLRDALPDEDEVLIENALQSVGVPLDAFSAFEPWMVAISLSSMKLLAEGYDINSGVETIIETEAAEAGKSFAYMESVADQADAFDLLPEDTQIEYLYQTALMLDDAPVMLDQLVSEWADGDIEGLSALIATPDGLGGGEEIYESLLVNRNRNWVPRVKEFLDQPGTIMIAVGSGHLVGPDSLIAMLRAEGYDVELN